MKAICFIFFIALNIAYSEVIHKNSFETSENIYASTAKPEFVKYNGRPALKITNAKTAQGSHVVFYKYSLGDFNGYTMRITCDIAIEEVSKPKLQTNGVKLMYAYTLDEVAQYDEQQDIKYGNSDWVTTSFDIITYKGETVSDGLFSLGLQDAIGTVYFSNLVIERILTVDMDWQIPAGFQCQYTTDVQNRVMARGINAPTNCTEGDIIDIDTWGGNLVRFRFVGYAGPKFDLDAYRTWFEAKLEELQVIIDKTYTIGMYIDIALIDPPGGRHGDTCEMYLNKTLHDFYLWMWEEIAYRFRAYPNIYAYDLISEPGYNKQGYIHYLQSQKLAIKRIRDIDAVSPIVVSFWPWPTNLNPYRRIRPFEYENIIYQLHMYNPYEYTHQGIGNYANNTGVFPGYINGVYYDRAKLDTIYQKIYDFQALYGAKIFVGEFAVPMWVNYADQFIYAIEDLCETHKWDWAYYVLRDDQAFDVERNYLDGPMVLWTNRKEALRKYYILNDPATMLVKPY